MGDDDTAYNYEKPAHWVNLAQSYELGQYPVTQALWEAVMREPWPHLEFQGKDRPVENVSWDDIMGTKVRVKKGNTPDGFLQRLNALPEIAVMNVQDGCQFALPTEAQWEHAARGGRHAAAFRSEYAGSNHLPDVGWHDDNSHEETQPVGRKQPNALGLYDMSGNVWEWCEDVWHDNYKAAPKDGAARGAGKDKGIRVVRGGSWSYSNDFSRVTNRGGVDALDRYYSIGFRLSRYRVTL
jgi:formylglycine-generating enzyme required for sulfatase activity